MKILMTGVGGPTPRSFAIALKKYSFYKRFEIIATDINPLSIGLYQAELFSKGYVVPRCTDANYWDAIEKIVKNKLISAAFDEFKKRYQTSQPNPGTIGKEFNPQLEFFFHYFRLCRNNVGHPIEPPNISELTQGGVHSIFYTYTLDIQEMVNWYKSNKITL
jgi:hypothetical protein